MPDLGAPEVLIILLIVFLLFGAQRLPKLGRSLGQSISGFKKGLNEDAPLDDEDAQPGSGSDTKTPPETKAVEAKALPRSRKSA